MRIKVNKNTEPNTDKTPESILNLSIVVVSGLEPLKRVYETPRLPTKAHDHNFK